ncbi:MAG: tetratricopeptide repeat protein [Lysobacter sp.]|nr:tetratricopeptide repeat protein [Lysobacter sp.]
MSDDLRTEQWLRQAQRMVNGGHLDRAIDLLTRALSEDPDSGDAHAMLAFCLVGKKRLYAAELEAGYALALESDSPFAHLAMGAVSLSSRKFVEAERHFDAAKELAPESAEAHRLAASLYRLWGKPERAQTEIEQARTLDPESPDIRAQSGWLAFDRGERDDARGHAIAALEIDPEHVDALTLLGHCDLAAGRTEEARAHALWALQQEPGDSGAMTLFAAVKARKSWLLGVWWRFQSFVNAGSQRRTIALLIGAYLLYRIGSIALFQNGLKAESLYLTLAWLAFCVYTWFAPTIFWRSIRKEMETVRLRPDY